MSRLTPAQKAVLVRMSKPCDIEDWKYGPLSHPFDPDSRTYRSLINRGLIIRDDAQTRTREGWLFVAFLCTLTPAGRAATEGA